MYDVTIVGCGVVGASLAYTLSQYRLRVLVLERENDVAMGTTKANSAIVHAGYDPENGTLMAKLNVRGSELMEQLCSDLSVGYKRIGSFVLAFDEEQKKHLKQTSFLHTKHHIGSKLMTSPFHLILIRKIYQEIKQAQRYHI